MLYLFGFLPDYCNMLTFYWFWKLSNVDTKYREVSRILAPCENNFFPPESSNPSFPHTSNHVCHTSTDETFDEVDVLPNFSEFKDPWENYVEHSNHNENNHPNEINHDNINSHNHDDNNCPFPPQNYQIQYCLIENDNSLNNIINDFKNENFHGKISNLITNNNNHFNFNHEDNFDDKKSEQINKTFTDHVSENFFLNVGNRQLQDNDCNNENTNNIEAYYDHKSPIHQSNYVNFRNEQNYSNQNDNNCNMLQIEPLEREQLKLNNLTEVITQNPESLNHVEKVIECNELVLDSDSHPNSCTDLQSIASQSQMNSMDEIDSAGIAGALSKLILGEPRSPEQMIYEDHVRKQSWEQGQIDYMGRDSFDNIWKKICTTLSTTPEEKPQLKEKALPESEEEKVPSSDVPKVPLKAVPDSSDTTTEDKSAIEAKLQDAITDSHSKQTDKNISDVVSVSSAIPSGELKQFPERKIQEAAFSSTPTSPLSPETCERKTEPILALKSPPPQLCIKEFGEKMTSEVKESAEIREKSKEEENKSASVTPLSCPMSKPKTPVEESTIESPVPIQVAESVLEADIKESVSEDVKPVREEAISSTSASVQETISAVVQTPLEPLAMLSQSIAVPPPQPNGSALDIDPNFAMKKEPLRAQVPSESIVTSTSPVSESRSAPSLQDTPTTRQETKKETKVDDVPDVPKVCRKQSSVASTTDIGPTKVPEPVLQESNKLTNKESPKVQLKEIKSDESSTSEASKPDDSAIKVTEQPAEETKPNVPTASEKTEPACPRKPQDPAKPTRSKELKIPGTPIVTEATPPTSPPIEAGASLTEEPKPVKKVTKKVTKKGSEDKPEKSEGEEGKKGAKKVVKKVMKKPKDGEEEAESSVTGEKPKKVVKTVKKTTKLPSQTLEADASVPDTPPPTTSDTPVPPKRKVKSTTTKTSKKSESES
ncbi:general transcriptional corepressor trfA isoform X1 [Chelonus insularis]|uniref:general transcriptional corepressor trfA isoform X1 n=1 Tax=Chelonus insularis TaxID=460826 RepID=UPI00158D1BBB|nr:general transcriptional corepressor trfA isoform X1 [Chelonus insularis]